MLSSSVKCDNTHSQHSLCARHYFKSYVYVISSFSPEEVHEAGPGLTHRILHEETEAWQAYGTPQRITQPGNAVQFSSVQSLSRVRLFATPWTATHQASLSFTNSQSLLRLMSIELEMPSSHLILCLPLLLLPLILPSIRVFSNESVLHIRWPKYIRWPTNKITQKYLAMKMAFKVLAILWVL